MNTSIKRLLFPLSGCLLLAYSQTSLAADFSFNWTQLDSFLGGGADINCNRPGTQVQCGTSSGFGGHGGSNVNEPDNTPILQEIVSIPSGPNAGSYFHMIIGSVDSNGNPINPTAANQATIPFAQEVFIRIQSGTDCNLTNCSFSGGDVQSSGGGRFGVSMGNGYNPLSSNQTLTGNGTGYPTRAAIKTLINDAEVQQTFLKDTLALKPKISQNITTLGLSGQFVMDMTNSGYSTNTTPGVMTNKVTLTGANAGIQGNFDAAGPNNDFATANTQAANVTGGRYTFTPGSGWNTSGTIFTEGTYNYVGGGSADNMNTLDWNAFRDPQENVMQFGFGNTPGTRLRSGDICKGGTASSPPTGC